MSESGVCTACGAAAEVNEQQMCPDCAGGSMEAPAAEPAAPAESEDAQADGGDEAAA